MPCIPRPTLHMLKSFCWSGSSPLICTVPNPGVTSFIATTWLSTGGIDAPVPCADTWTNPPNCCSLIDARFSSVNPWGRSASSTWLTLAPACTVTLFLHGSTWSTLSISARDTIPPFSNEMPFGDRPAPVTLSLVREAWHDATSCSSSSRVWGWCRVLVVTLCVPDQLMRVCRLSASPSSGSFPSASCASRYHLYARAAMPMMGTPMKVVFLAFSWLVMFAKDSLWPL
mmetsp:Transcript_35036/g.85242  ORF Transcript_35036/g.85242 Transcript_35036/m.85242 type:complete len:228 (+) Transcript_35036:1039-1722(+)